MGWVLLIPPLGHRMFIATRRYSFRPGFNRTVAPLDRDDSSSPRSPPAAPDPRFEIGHFGLRAEPEPQQEVRCQQRDVTAGGTIDLDDIGAPEILDPRPVQR